MIAEYPLIPDQAFLYLPDPERIVETRNGQPYRIIFSGNVPFSQNEKQEINNLRDRIRVTNPDINKYPDDFLLRFLQATNFQHLACIDQLIIYSQWERKMLPLTPTDAIIRRLKVGIIYMCGRDYHFRPIIIIDVKKILDIKISQSELLELLGFFFQYIVENCLIEGQVETWNTIIDLGNSSVFSLGGTLMDIIKHMSSIFKARSNHNYLLRCPSTIKMIWGMVKKVLNEDQLRKISLSDSKTLKQQDFTKINRNQIEVKYGGQHPDIKNYWPIQIDPYTFSVTSKQVPLLSPDAYDKMNNDKAFENRKIKKSLLRKYTKTRLQRIPSFKPEQEIVKQMNLRTIVQEQEVIYPEESQPRTVGEIQGGNGFWEGYWDALA